MDLLAVRTFVAVADAGQFSEAAIDLEVTQQAASKRVAALEKELGVRLLDRTARGTVPTTSGRAFLPHARELLRVAEQAEAAIRPERRPLRVDVISTRIGPASLLREFHETHAELALEVVTLFDATTALAAVRSGQVDATFRAVSEKTSEGLDATRILDEPLQLLTGPTHPLAAAEAVSPAQLAAYPIRMLGLVSGTEWTAYYDELCAAFGLRIETEGPNFGAETLFERIAGSSTAVTLVSERMRLRWPEHQLRRIPIRDPTPVYPHSLVWRSDNSHPALAALRRHLGTAPWTPGTWVPPAFLPHPPR